jgi:hypothetical protein
MPRVGFRHSGYGKDLSMFGLEDYTQIKHVMSTWMSRPADKKGEHSAVQLRDVA